VDVPNATGPEMVDVAVVDVALKLPNKLLTADNTFAKSEVEVPCTNVMFEKLFVPLNVLFVYVLGIVVDASTK
jgi:hypothetical protein